MGLARCGKKLNEMLIKLNGYMVRDWLKEDAEAIAKYANNRNIWINMRDLFPFPYKFSDAKAFLEMAIKPGPKTFFAIATAGEAIGGIGLNLQKDVHRYTAELGYWLAESFWCRGIMTKAVEGFSRFAFDAYDLHRLYATPYAYNEASIRVLEKSGFVKEGLLRANAFKDGRVVDQYIYARLKDGTYT